MESCKVTEEAAPDLGTALHWACYAWKRPYNPGSINWYRWDLVRKLLTLGRLFRFHIGFLILH
jgi:hypothetical protein